MKTFFTDKEVKAIRQTFRPGATVEMVEHTDHFHPIPAGTRGTVCMVDDFGRVHVQWSDHSCSELIPMVDKVKFI